LEPCAPRRRHCRRCDAQSLLGYAPSPPAQKSSCSFTTSASSNGPHDFGRSPSGYEHVPARQVDGRNFVVGAWSAPRGPFRSGRGRRDRRPGSRTRGARPANDWRALAFIKSRDCLVVWKLDHLGRSLPHLLDTVTEKLAAVTSALDDGAAVIQFSRLLVLRAQEPATSLDSFLRASRNDQSWHGGASVSASVGVSSPVKCMPVA
jgi:hypothetical protein